MRDMSYYPGTYTDDARIRDGYRVRVVQDEDVESPLEWGDHITTDSDEYKRWASGEVYGVIVERSVSYVPLDDAENLIRSHRHPEESTRKLTQWEEIESLWSCYLDPGYTGLTVAHNIAPEAVAEG